MVNGVAGQRWGPDGAVAGGSGAAGSAAGAGSVTPVGPSPLRVATAGARSTPPCWPHSLLCTVTVMSPANSPWGCGRSDSTWVVACTPATPSSPTQGNVDCSGRDSQRPSRNSKTTGAPPGDLGRVWSASSSGTPTAAHQPGAQDERNAHQVSTSGGCGSGVWLNVC